MRDIFGAGGGGKSSGGSGFAVKEAADSLESVAFAQVIDCISEGEIVGLVDGMHSIKLDDTPLVDENGNPNFKEVQVELRNGTQIQTHIPGFPLSANTTAVGVEVRNDTPVTRTINNANVTSIGIMISIPSLQTTDSSNGNVNGGRVDILIERNTNGAGWVKCQEDEIIGKCSSKYQKSYLLILTTQGSHDIRVSRLTADTNSQLIQDKIYWESYTEFIDGKLTYPNSALIAIRVDAKNFRSVPKRSYHIKGLKIKVPVNYDPVLRTYDGIWSGDFKTVYSNNSAWVLYDLLTNSRYGCGIPESAINKWEFYDAGQYCDEWIDDGRGNLEPRYTTNAYFQTKAEAYQMIKVLSTVMNAIVFWQGGELRLMQDSPKDATHLFTNSNVIDGKFTYHGTPKSSRYSVALITYNDKNDSYKQKVEYVQDEDAIADFGIVPTEITNIGCTSQGQAHRFGRAVLYASLKQTQTVGFETGLEGSSCALGEISKIANTKRTGIGIHGRVKNATTHQMTSDRDFVFDFANQTYQIEVMLPDGTVAKTKITGSVGRIWYFQDDLVATPFNQSVWVLTTLAASPSTFRIVNVREENGRYQITALQHSDAKYDYIEKDIILPDPISSTLSITPDSPQNLKITENLYVAGTTVKNKAIFSWESVPNASSYLPQYKKQDGNTVVLTETRTNEVEILDIPEGIYDFSVAAVSAFGIKSGRVTINAELRGKTAPPADVVEFSLVPIADMAYLSWKPAEDLDVLIGGKIRIRFSDKTGPALNWMDAVDIATLPGNSTRHAVPLRNGTYMARFIDSSDNASVNVVSVYTSAMEASSINIVHTMTEHPAFAGAKVNMQIMAQYNNALMLMSPGLIDDVASIDDLGAIDFAGDVGPTGTYTTAVHDLGGVFTCRVSGSIKVKAYDTSDLIDARKDKMDDWADFDATNLDTVNAETFMVTTEDDPANPAAVWTPRRRFEIGDYKFRGIYFIMEASTQRPTHSIAIEELEFVIDVPDRRERKSGLISLAPGYLQVTYDNPFYAAPVLGITTKTAGGAPVEPDIINQTATGFQIRFVDSTGTPVVRTFDYIADGYGMKV